MSNFVAESMGLLHAIQQTAGKKNLYEDRKKLKSY